MSDKKVKASIIGFGKMGAIREEALIKNKRVEIKSIFDPSLSTHDKYLVIKDVSEIIKDKSIDTVFLCSYNKMNIDLTFECLKHEKNVFCEKPPAFSSAEMLRIIDLEKKSGKKLMYGFNHRHHPSIKKIKELVSVEEYGKVLWMRGRYGKSVDEEYLSTWRANKDLAGGGILLDQGLHMLDLFNYIAGDFDEVKAFVSSLYWKTPGIEDNVFAMMRNSKTGVCSSLHSTMTQWRHLFSLEVFLEEGYMVLNGLQTSSNTYGDEILTIAKNRTKAPAASWDDEERIEFKTDNSWQEEVNHFIESIYNDEEIQIGNSYDALKLMQLVDRIYDNERRESEKLYTSL